MLFVSIYYSFKSVVEIIVSNRFMKDCLRKTLVCFPIFDSNNNNDN